MNLEEFDNFRLTDAVKFHDQLNPKLFFDDHLREDVRTQLIKIAEDFKDYLGIVDLEVKDIVITGSNAAYSYTQHSDIDLHLIVDIAKLNNDAIYKELFNAKKIVYNEHHDITVRGYDVELYVEDQREPAKSLGEYSVLKNRWIKYPSKRRANFDEKSTMHKFQKLIQLSELALRSDDVNKVDLLLSIIRKYRYAGLEVGGEFSPENLSYKVLRSHGIIDQLYDHSDKLRSKNLSIDESNDEYAPPGAPIEDTRRIHDEIIRRMNHGGAAEKFVWLKPSQISGSHSESYLRSLGFKQSYVGKWGGTQKMWDKLLGNTTLEENASGYIPSEKEKNDWRWKTGLTVDVKPDSLKNNAKKLGLGNIHRSGVPRIAKTNGKIT